MEKRKSAARNFISVTLNVVESSELEEEILFSKKSTELD